MNPFITPKEMARQLNITYAKILELLQNGTIPAKRIKTKWMIVPDQCAIFKAKNAKKIKQLQEVYVKLYWGGLTHKQIQRQVSKDFKRLGIVAPIRGFAETTIYESLKSGESIDSR